MKKVLLLFLFILVLACTSTGVWSECGKCEFAGNWILGIDTKLQENDYPWSDEIRYPESLHVEVEEGVTLKVSFQDQKGGSCFSVRTRFDPEIRALIFKHCLPSADPDWGGYFFIFTLEGKDLVGVVQDYRVRFRLRGKDSGKIPGSPISQPQPDSGVEPK